MGSQCGAAGADRYLRSRLGAARQRVQYGRWMPAVMDACLARWSKTGTSMGNWVKRAVQISQRVVDGRGVQDTEGEG